MSSLTDAEINQVCVISGMLLMHEHQKRHLTRRWWARPWLMAETRRRRGYSNNFVEEVREEDVDTFVNYFRMSPSCFDTLLAMVGPYIVKQDTKWRDALTPHTKLCITLRFLASGLTYRDMQHQYRVSASAISEFVPEVCEVIFRVLEKEYVSPPTTPIDKLRIAERFEERWNFPHCVGAIDGKHVYLKAPPNSGSVFFNYKKRHSIVLLAVADADYRITAFDIGAPGSQSDSRIFSNGPVSSLMDDDALPSATPLTGRFMKVPYYLIGDDAFALSCKVMKPFSHSTTLADEKIFNYRICRARRIVESAFGIMSSKFRVLRTTINTNVANTKLVVRACVALHNYLITTDDRYSHSMDSITADKAQDDDNSRQDVEVDNHAESSDNTGPTGAPSGRDVRQELLEYFFNEGAVSFQWALTD